MRGFPGRAIGHALLAPMLLLSTLASAQPAAPQSAASLPAPSPCPEGLPAETHCLAGRDALGAFILIAVPKAWNGVAIVHAHGGPELGPPKAERGAKDLKRWAVMVKAGYAWAGTTFRQGGVAVRSAAEDTERLRVLFNEAVGKPRLTILHGQSWGASVAARVAEFYPTSFDGVLLTSGVLGGGSRSYDFRLDLRVVYQVLCGNHPAADEPQYPLWEGLPLDSKLTRAQLSARIEACTGVRRPEAQRTPDQQRKLDTLLRVVPIPERSLIGHLNWATWHFQDIAYTRLQGRNAFDNEHVRYTGSDDDVALNRAVARYRKDPRAAARFADDTDPTGRIGVPVLTLHAIDDPTAFVELETVFGETMAAAGHAGNLVQTYTREQEHSYLSDAEYPALMAALLDWVERGTKPTPHSVAQRCRTLQARFGGGCFFDEAYVPGPLSQRIAPR
jgi:pimeloyl-ACP methyl ester carboxylesterase